MIRVNIYTEKIKLKEALKFSGATESGAAGKKAVEEGKVLVNGKICFVPGKKLSQGDVFRFNGEDYLICYEN